MGVDGDFKTNTVPVSSKTSILFVQFEGLRGLAIIIVVLSHCGILRQGGIANAVFFVLSGFLLINPFKDRYEQRFLSVWNILKFYGSRALKILPSYYIVLLLMFLITGFNVIPKDTFIDLLYFGDIYEHLWYIYSYFWIMLFIPFFFFIFLILSRYIRPLNNDLVCSILNIVFSGLIRLFFIYTDLFDIRIDQLMIGIGIGYLFRYLKNNEKLMSFAKNKPVIGDMVSVIFLLFVIFSSSPFLGLFDPGLSYYYIGWHFIYLVGLITGLFVLSVCLFPGSVTGNILSSVFLRFTGKLSYPIYLLNYFAVGMINIRSEYLLFLCVFSVCVIIAWIMDTVISKVISLIKNAANKNIKAVQT